MDATQPLLDHEIFLGAISPGKRNALTVRVLLAAAGLAQFIKALSELLHWWSGYADRDLLSLIEEIHVLVVFHDQGHAAEQAAGELRVRARMVIRRAGLKSGSADLQQCLAPIASIAGADLYDRRLEKAATLRGRAESNVAEHGRWQLIGCG